MSSDITQLKSAYDELSPHLHRMTELVSVLLEQEIRKRAIKIHSLRSRVKEFSSFYNKIKIKNYKDPFSRCQDLAGCRVICLFKDQIEPLLAIIRDNFIVVGETKRKHNADQFRYAAHHVVISLKKDHPQHTSLKGVVCEIQVRTILQDAWAEIEHYVNYKHIGVDEDLLRKVNALSALFEIADDQFFTIHKGFQEITTTTTLVKKQTINPVLLYHYCKATFPWAWSGDFEQIDNLDEYAILVERFIASGITTINQLNERYERTKDNIQKDEDFHVKEVLNNPSTWPKLYKRVKTSGHFYSPLVILAKLIGESKA